MSSNGNPIKELSERDLSVLGHIFDDFGAENGLNPLANTTGPDSCSNGAEKPDVAVAPKLEIDADTLNKIKALEIEAVQVAERGASTPESSNTLYLESISKFSEIIDLCPEYASAWNNR
ncbi:hypothetical protein DSO57_1039073 [Entomophthora muscae]|uniref:Uncharacterized protein n=1 Tax=Entomophthora muscae TaxID=34485 RepID=A0ACC2SYR7_9FUNG|nr:hypothetical protein DSO57_1039073 [Entomophthora muscae]